LVRCDQLYELSDYDGAHTIGLFVVHETTTAMPADRAKVNTPIK